MMECQDHHQRAPKARSRPIHHQITLRFYAELKDFLSTDPSSGMVIRTFEVPGTVKDVIEACGVPHTEVDLIIANGQSVGFSYIVEPGDRISVFPVFESFDISPIVKVRPEPLRTMRFVADGHLGTLARFLRLVGLDTLYNTDWDDPELVRISVSEHRVILTRDIGLLKHGSVSHGHYVRSTDARQQLIEVVRHFHLAECLLPFTRCMACNGQLAPMGKEEIAERLPPGTREHIDEFQMCVGCTKIYWEGAHHHDLERIVASVHRTDFPLNRLP